MSLSGMGERKGDNYSSVREERRGTEGDVVEGARQEERLSHTLRVCQMRTTCGTLRVATIPAGIIKGV